MSQSVSRRGYLGVLLSMTAVGCVGNGAASATEPPDAAEMGGIELADVHPQPLQTRVGITAVVYNDTSERSQVTVEFAAYAKDGTELHRGRDSVGVDAGQQAPISRYWEKNPDNPPFQGWDAAIVNVE